MSLNNLNCIFIVIIIIILLIIIYIFTNINYNKKYINCNKKSKFQSFLNPTNTPLQISNNNFLPSTLYYFTLEISDISEIFLSIGLSLLNQTKIYSGFLTENFSNNQKKFNGTFTTPPIIPKGSYKILHVSMENLYTGQILFQNMDRGYKAPIKFNLNI